MPSEIVEEKRFYTTCLTIFLSFLIPVMLVVLLFLTVPKLRHAVFLFTLDLPGYATNFILKQYVPPRQFGKAVPWLERELRLVNWFAPPRNRLLPGLIQNIEYVLTKEHFVNVFTENGKISKEGLDEFLEMQHPKFALKLELGEEVYVSNPTLYEYGNFCKLKGSSVSCSQEFRDFYLVDGKLERAKINVVMKNA